MTVRDVQSDREFPIPVWIHDAVFYQIFPDRFAYSANVQKPENLQPWGSPPTHHGYQGGDLWGVVARLDYLTDLGVNAIRLNPVFQSASNHRYHTHDYFEVDPMLGGNAALRGLLDAAHTRGIRVVLDGVFNHTSRGFFQFHDLLENGRESAYLDWFMVERWPLRPYGPPPHNYHAWWNNPALPKFNTNTPAVRRFLFDVARHWIEFGIDGWRLDVPAEIDDDAFWRTFRRVVKQANPEAYIVGEIWDDAHRWLQGDQFDAVMNYPIGRAALGFFGGHALDPHYHPGGFHVLPLDASSFLHTLRRLLDRHPWPVTLAQLNMLDSHDTARVLHQAGGDRAALQLMLLFLLTAPGAPCIYYGTEIGMTGGPDPDCRRAFPSDESAWDHDLLSFARRAIALRHAHAALRYGDFEALYAEGRACAYGRRYGDDAVVSVFNAGQTPVSVAVPVRGFLSNGAFDDALNDSPGRVADGLLRLELAGQAAAVFAAP